MKIRTLTLTALLWLAPVFAAEPQEETQNQESSPSSVKREAPPKKKSKYFIEDPERVDAGTMHLGFAVGGNFYIQPEVFSSTRLPTGNYYKDFGFQGGAYLDFDYSDIAFGLRTFIGYKYIMSSVHVFDLEGLLRYLIRISNAARLSANVGVSAGLWYQVRDPVKYSNQEVIVFLPSLVLGASFDIIPFMVDFRWVINRFGSDTAITGFELSFGVKI